VSKRTDLQKKFARMSFFELQKGVCKEAWQNAAIKILWEKFQS